MKEPAIKTQLLRRWAQVCEEYSKHNFTCWCQIKPDGVETTMISPEGGRAFILIPYKEMAEADVPPNTIHQILAELKKSIQLHSSIIIPPAFTGVLP